MNHSMINAMSSIHAYQQKIDTISDNVANMNTVGYKKKSTVFQDLLTNAKQQPSSFALEGRLSPINYNQGWGSRVSGVLTDFTQGVLSESRMPTDMAIEGNALFEVIVNAEGQRAYTRDGSFQLSLDSNNAAILTSSDGHPVVGILPDGSEGRIIIPDGYTMKVQNDGTVLAVSNDDTLTVGTMKLVNVIRPDAVTAINDNLFAVSAGVVVDSVIQRVVPTTTNGLAIHQGFLEQSNVNVASEMSELVRVQRAYQLAARALTSSESMMQMANNLRT